MNKVTRILRKQNTREAYKYKDSWCLLNAVHIRRTQQEPVNQSAARNRRRLERASQKQSSDTNKTPYDRVKRCRERKINIKASERVNVEVLAQNKRSLSNNLAVVRAQPSSMPQARGCVRRRYTGLMSTVALCLPWPHIPARRAAITDRLAYSPTITANRVHSPAGLADLWESCRTMLLVGWFSRGSLVSPATSFRRCSIHVTLIGSQDIVVMTVSLLASHKGNPGSIPGRVIPDFRMWESCRMMPLVSGFSRGSPVSPPLHSGATPYSSQSPSLVLKTSMLVGQVTGAQHKIKVVLLYLQSHFTLNKKLTAIRARGRAVASALASHQDGPGSIPGGFAPGFLHVRIVLDDVACRVSFHVMFKDDGHLRVPTGKPVARRVLPRPGYTPYAFIYYYCNRNMFIANVSMSSAEYVLSEVVMCHIWNYFPYFATNFTVHLSPRAPVKIYAGALILLSFPTSTSILQVRQSAEVTYFVDQRQRTKCNFGDCCGSLSNRSNRLSSRPPRREEEDKLTSHARLPSSSGLDLYHLSVIGPVNSYFRRQPPMPPATSNCATVTMTDEEAARVSMLRFLYLYCNWSLYMLTSRFHTWLVSDDHLHGNSYVNRSAPARHQVNKENESAGFTSKNKPAMAQI
ncbi:hypothetical protein PR048_009742 [Dryococelus australis]|uniref:Uncharacterized protein n=1 Tax=Dryococelus australis TaxID=614101 RepID=A0ABQ9I0T4_9NEOP|nr:hypothetical protein PR048_009742 [Dryococelus australis]